MFFFKINGMPKPDWSGGQIETKSARCSRKYDSYDNYNICRLETARTICKITGTICLNCPLEYCKRHEINKGES